MLQEGSGPEAAGGGWVQCVGAGAWAMVAKGADTCCDRSRIDARRSSSSCGGWWSCVGGRLASCEETSRGFSLWASFSAEIVVSLWVTPNNWCEMVTKPLISWDRRVMTVDSEGVVPDQVYGLKSGRSR